MKAMGKWSRIAAGIFVAVGLAGCDLDEVTIPDGEDVLIVEAILDAGREEQYVLLHHTLNGRVVGGEDGALVRVRRGDGLEVVFTEAPADACTMVDPAYADGEAAVDVRATCYVSPAAEGRWVVPGAEYELLIETVDGKRLQGRTTVPGSFEPISLSAAARRPTGEVGQCVLPPDTPLALEWTVSAGARAYLTHMRVEGLPEALEGSGIPNIPDVVTLFGILVSETDTTIVVPTQVGVFERQNYDNDLMLALNDGFPEGVRVRITLGAMDRNFVNGIRVDSFHPSGPVRVSSVHGDGAGVFGSFVPYAFEIEVRSGDGVGCLEE